MNVRFIVCAIFAVLAFPQFLAMGLWLNGAQLNMFTEIGGGLVALGTLAGVHHLMASPNEPKSNLTPLIYAFAFLLGVQGVELRMSKLNSLTSESRDVAVSEAIPRNAR